VLLSRAQATSLRCGARIASHVTALSTERARHLTPALAQGDAQTSSTARCIRTRLPRAISFSSSPTRANWSFNASTFTHRPSRIDLHASTFTHRPSRIDLHASTFTHRPSRIDLHR
jgi:hypothetical protein